MEKYGQDAYKSKKINKLFFLIPIGIFAVVLTTLIAVKNHSKPTTVSSGNTDASLTENVSLANIPETTLSTLANVVSIDSFANESKRVIESIAGTTARMTNPVTTESIIQTAARATWVYPTIVPSRAVSTTKAAETRSVTREINTSSYSAIPPRTSSTTTRATWTYTTAPARAVYTTKAATTVFQPRETNPPTTQPKTNSTTAKAHTINLYFAAEKASDAENNRAKLSISYKIDSNYKLKDFVLHLRKPSYTHRGE